MTPTETKVQTIPAALLEQALALPDATRLALGERLIESVGPAAPPSPPEVREVWRTELGRRIDAYLRGEVKALDAKESIARARAKLREKFGYEV